MKFVTVAKKKIHFLDLILNSHCLCKLSRDATYRRKQKHNGDFDILEENILGYNNNKNHRITVILALCKLCISHFLILRSVLEVYQLLKKLCRSSKLTVIKNMKIIPILNLCKLCIFYFVLVELWAGLRCSRDLIENHCRENKLLKFVLWLFKRNLLSFVLFWIDAIYANYQET